MEILLGLVVEPLCIIPNSKFQYYEKIRIRSTVQRLPKEKKLMHNNWNNKGKLYYKNNKN